MVSFVEFLAGATMLDGLMIWCGVWPDWIILVIPVFILIVFIIAIGARFWI